MVAAAVRPDSPGAGSEHSWDSAPTEAGGGASQLGSSAGSERASTAGSSASGDSIHNLKAALARKKQLLNARKEQMERSARTEDPEREVRGQSGQVRTAEDAPAQVRGRCAMGGRWEGGSGGGTEFGNVAVAGRFARLRHGIPRLIVAL